MAEQNQRGTTRTVASNTAWYALELAVSLFQRLVIGVPVARLIGPEKLGYFSYIQWLTTVTGVLGTMGIPIAARKYTAEYLARNEPQTVDRIYTYCARIQLAISVLLVAIGLVMVHLWGEEAYRIPSTLLVVAILPRMMIFIPSNINMAAQRMRDNVPAAVAGAVTEAIIVVTALFRDWGLTGVAAGQVSGYMMELLMKSVSLRRWLRPAPEWKLPGDLKKRMTSFSGQSLALLALNLVVWDRSDVFFLKMLNPDTRQVSFFSLAFTLVDRILVMPKSFTVAVGANLMAQFSGDRERLNHVAALAARYSLLFAAPVMVGLAAVSGPLIRLVYGQQYLPVIPVLTIGACLAVVKPLLDPAQNLMQAAERQKFLIGWGLFCAAVNIALDLTLIPLGAAKGAMWANGLAQALTIAGIWVKATRAFQIRLPWGALTRILLSGAGMGAAVYALTLLHLPGYVVLALQVVTGAALYPALLRMTGVLDAGDRRRLDHLVAAAPRRMRRFMETLLDAVAGPVGRPVRSS